ncbi:carbohydrate-binding protein [Microbacterium ureisolvens]|uniref:carbohydrate-binding protein n=1 Tax=Microbacterium ureisolvens TaxID=2781186 RepID=UPI00363D0C65
MRFRRSAVGLVVATGVVVPLSVVPPAAATQVTASSAAASAPPEYDWSNAAISGGGYVPGIVYSQTEPGLVYARTDIGGAYRLDRDTDTWVPLLDHVGWDDWNRLGVLSLATDPVDTNRVYVATGMYTNEWDPSNGAILRSDDYGATWDASPLPFKVGGNMPGRGIGERLQVDPSDNDVLYYGAEQGQGLWRSTDAGATFSRVETFPNAGDFVPDAGSGNSYLMQNLGVLWTAFDTSATDAGAPTRTVFTAVADTDEILYRSDDAGATWQPVAGAPTGFLPHHGIVDEAGRFLYLSTSNTSGPYDGSDGQVWRYGIDDGTWTEITPTLRPVGVDFGFGGLTIDRSDPGTIMVASQIQWWPDILIFRSTDRGETWTPIWDYAYDETGGYVAARYSQSIDEVPWLAFGKEVGGPVPWAEPTPKLGWMVSALEIDPFDSDELMYGTGATIYRSEDLTAWDEPGGVIHLTPEAFGIEETAIQDLVAPAGSVDLVSAMLDLGGFVHDDLGTVPQSFQAPYFGGGTSVDVAGLEPAVIVRAGTDAGGARVVAASVDAGESWTTSPAAEGATGSGTVTVNADGSGIVWAPDGVAVRHSADGGATFAEVAGLPVGARVESDRVDPRRVYAFAGGVFYRSDDGGATFGAVSEGALPAEGPVRFAATPGSIADVWLAGGSDEGGAYGLWHSQDGGATWTATSGFDEADTVGFGKAAPGATTPAIYTAASRDGERGVYRSTDGGASWSRINDEAHQWGWIGADIEGDPDVFGRVYIATNGRGIVVGDDTAASDPAAWQEGTVYDTGDVVASGGAVWVASWWTRGQEPGSKRNGAWQEIAATPTGVAVWTASRIFDTGDVVSSGGELWRARWWTRGDEPGAKKNGPWERIG